MRLMLLLSLLLTAVPVETGTLRGTVVCEGTSEPISGVQISVGGEVRAVTDNGGNFVVQNTPAGTTSVRALREGFFGPPVNGNFPRSALASVVVTADQPANLKITLVPAGSVSGSIFDANGKPMHDSIVGILRVVQRNGSPVVDVIQARPSGDDGQYRLYPVPPGEYYVGVAPSIETHTTTLYPSATNLSFASRIVVKAAEELKGIDIRTHAGK